jgi:uncharacterized hydrophobic protein (TIGR00271 family)
VIHVRLVSPPDVTVRLAPTLRADRGVRNLIVQEAAVHNPDGDAIQFDLLQGRANQVLGRLRQLGLDERGAICLEPVTVSIPSPDQSTDTRQRFEEFIPVWEEVDARIRGGARFPPSWFLLMIIAGLIAAVGLVLNSQILIVGAMVVGPEYYAIVGLSYGSIRNETAMATRSAVALAAGFGLAIVAALLLGLIIRAADLAPRAFVVGIRPVSDLINSPDWFSVIVAVLAGLVGVISLTEARAATLIGVFISVTTIPAAADIGVSSAYGSGQEALGSAEQLFLNVFLLAAVAAVGIPLQRRIWRRITDAGSSPEERSDPGVPPSHDR